MPEISRSFIGKNTQRQTRTFWSRFLTYHKHAVASSLERLSKTPIASLLTIFAIGIALAVPLYLSVLLQNINSVVGPWHNQAKVRLYLQTGSSDKTIQQVLQQLKRDPHVYALNYISPMQGLQEWNATTDLRNEINSLPQNPLPPLIEITPKTTLMQNSQALTTWVNGLQNLPGANAVAVDSLWLQRLAAILKLVQHIGWSIGLILGVAVALIIGNTIRLVIQQQRDEISILALIGATPLFIRLPFLYLGLFYGVMGAMLALICVFLMIILLKNPVLSVAKLYASHFILHNISILQSLTLISVAASLGLLGAWWVVSQQLNRN